MENSNIIYIVPVCRIIFNEAEKGNKMAKNKFYAIRKGKKVGIFKTWDECKEQVNGFSGAEYKSFTSIEDANEYIGNIEKKYDSNELEDGIIAYVDGSYEESKGAFSYGVIILDDDKKHVEFGKSSDSDYIEMRNVSGEILAATKAMEYVDKFHKNKRNLTIYYDYEGIEKWCTGAWEAKKDKTMEYTENYKIYSENINIRFNKVKSHSGDKYNDIVDKIAKYALDENIEGIITEIEYNTCGSKFDKLIEKSKELNISLSEAKEMITKICEEKDIVYRIKDIDTGNNVKQISIHLEKNLLNSIINIYSSKKGLTLSVDSNLNPELSSLVLTKMLNENQINKVEDKTYTYKKVSIEKIEKLISELEVFNDSSEYIFNKRENYANVKTFYEIISKSSKEKVLVTIYSNNTLTVSGKKYLLWEDVCYIIEQCLDITLDDIIGRINVGVDFDFKQDNCDNCDDELRKEFGDDLFDFIENHDYDVMLSVKCSFDYKTRVPDYGIYIDPLTKSFEGYFKKILNTLNISSKFEIKRSDWKLSLIFDSDKKLHSNLHSKLDVDLDIRDKQLDVMSKMCDKMWSIRNPINHSDYRGTLSYNSYEDAYKEYKEIIGLVIESYNLLIKK